MNVKGLIIHLARATDRRTQVERLLDECPLPTEVVDAVDGAKLDEQTQQQLYHPRLHQPHYPFALRIAEIACFASHRKCWQRIVDQDLDAGLILEDDVQLDPEVFPDALKFALEHMQSDDYVRFPEKRREQADSIRASTDKYRMIVPEVTGVGMIGQLVGRQVAQTLLERTQEFDRPVDSLLQMTWLTGVRPVSVYPGGITECSAELGGSRIGSRKSWAEMVRREVLRPIYRYRLASRARRCA